MRLTLSVFLSLFLAMSPLAYGQNIVTTVRGLALETYVPQIVAGGNYITVVTYEKAKKTNLDIQIGYDWGSVAFQPLNISGTIVSIDEAIPSGPFANQIRGYGLVSNITNLALGYVKVDVLNSVDRSLMTDFLRIQVPVDEWNLASTTKVRVILRDCSSGVCKDITSPLPGVNASCRSDFFAGATFAFAIANPNDRTATMIFTLESGEKVPLTLPPQGHLSKYMWELFPKMDKASTKTARFLIDSDTPVAVQPLEEKKDPVDGVLKYFAVDVATTKGCGV